MNVDPKERAELLVRARSGIIAANLSRRRRGIVQTVTKHVGRESELRLLVWLDQREREAFRSSWRLVVLAASLQDSDLSKQIVAAYQGTQP